MASCFWSTGVLLGAPSGIKQWRERPEGFHPWPLTSREGACANGFMQNLKSLRANPSAVRFNDLVRICDYFFGKPRISSSHYIYKMPWPGDPRVNIQNKSGMAKAYQVRQVLAAIDKLVEMKQ